MSSAAPLFFKEPFRYLRWASINKPAYFYSICVGLAGPGIVAVVVPVRKYLGYERIAKVPQTYPIPKGPRPRPSGFEDE
ncbi:n19m, NADH-ubiquinone oxidoreductase 9.5 kDa subunit [Kalmusia sp. IMI 367209]|nr:n19m, NADH-ubiquinone oxidoreductase 9.5 kDa subunit [Kalmusia sp. IMI 367209]